MEDTGQNPVISSQQIIKKPTAVTIFGILNIVFGCYYLVRGSPGSYKIVAGACKNPEKITGLGILVLLLLAVGIGLSIWLIVLGIGLLRMKRWSRRGSVMYARIQIVLMVIALGSLFISLAIRWASLPKDGWGFFNINNGLALIGWIYIVLLLIFMQTAKVKQAFAAIESI
jgi:hypothetical protein